jgi:hypothetical protein
VHKDSKHFDLQIDKQILAPTKRPTQLSYTRQAFIYAPTFNIRLETTPKPQVKPLT